jgi:hypothetical protein
VVSNCLNFEGVNDYVAMGHDATLEITATVPPGGGIGTGTVEVISSPTNGVLSFGRFVNE